MTNTRRMRDLTVADHSISVPLIWGEGDDGRRIDVHASVVTRDGGEALPLLVFLQGGPGSEAPRVLASPSSPSWLDDALKHHRVVMLDQRGTGKSTPVSDGILEQGTDAVVEYLTHLRADSIVADAEAMREHLGVDTWNTLGQSFGGFTTMAYLSTAASRVDRVYFTGGLSGIGHTTEDVYSLTYDKMRAASETYWRRCPDQRDAMRRLVELAGTAQIVLPDGEVLSVSRLRSLGMLLGSDHGWQTLWGILDQDPATNAFIHDLAGALPFRGRNPLYYVLHESSYADGMVTNWAAERAEPEDFRADPTLLTGEHIRREWSETVPAFQPWREVAEALAHVEWPRLYDADAIAASGVSGAAAVYYDDRFVPVEHSMATAALMPGVHVRVTSEHEHSGLRTGDVLPVLFDLADGRLIR
ncbi:MAG: alpha/beta fold hydrolase [Arachnia sp.]